MSWDCPCGASVGTANHWCEALQHIHALRVERLLTALIGTIVAGDDELEAVTVEELRDISATFPYPKHLT
jgi:hypothetical protein